LENQINQSLTSSPLRLVLLLEDLQFGGTQRQTLELARSLDPRRFQVEIWVMTGGDDLAALAREWRLSQAWLSRGREVGLVSLCNLWRRLRASSVEVLMPLTVVPNIWGRILGRLAGVPVIVGNCRGGAAPGRQHERLLWPLADHIICNAAALKARLTGGYGIPDHRVTVIPNGVDTDYFRPASKVSGSPVVLSVARLVPDKDHDTLIRAFRLAHAAHPQAELWLVGDGPQKQALQHLADDILPPGRVRFLPGQADLRPLLHRASLLVLSSATESLPNVVLEAMAAGLPVVSTRVGGLPEVVAEGQTGWLAPPQDAPALAAAISHLLADPETSRAFGRAGRELVKRRFSLASMVQRHEELLLNIWAGRGKLAQPSGTVA
jgi:glycosyltransferase involved in cell wall biosynthesis